MNDIIDTPEVLPSPNGVILLSMRSQIAVDIRTSRLEFSDRSAEKPNRTDFPTRVALAAEYIGKYINQNYAAISLNFDIEWDSDDKELPTEVMLGRIVKEDVLDGTGYNVIGASTGLWYVARARRHYLRIEPSGNLYDAQKYYANLNVQINLETETSSVEWLSQALDEEYADFIRVLAVVLASKKG